MQNKNGYNYKTTINFYFLYYKSVHKKAMNQTLTLSAAFSKTSEEKRTPFHVIKLLYSGYI